LKNSKSPDKRINKYDENIKRKTLAHSPLNILLKQKNERKNKNVFFEDIKHD